MNLVGDTSLVVDLSNSQLLAAASFLIGSQPWAVWRILQETAGRITGREASRSEAASEASQVA